MMNSTAVVAGVSVVGVLVGAAMVTSGLGSLLRAPGDQVKKTGDRMKRLIISVVGVGCGSLLVLAGVRGLVGVGQGLVRSLGG